MILVAAVLIGGLVSLLRNRRTPMASPEVLERGKQRNHLLEEQEKREEEEGWQCGIGALQVPRFGGRVAPVVVSPVGIPDRGGNQFRGLGVVETRNEYADDVAAQVVGGSGLRGLAAA